MLNSNPSHKIQDHELKDEMIFLTQKALTGPHDSQQAEDAEMPRSLRRLSHNGPPHQTAGSQQFKCS